MKGVPKEPRCGFSNTVVQILNMHNVDFDSHDVLQNEDLRQGERCFQQTFVDGCTSNMAMQVIEAFLTVTSFRYYYLTNV